MSLGLCYGMSTLVQVKFIVGATYAFDNITLIIFPSNRSLFDGNIPKVMLSNSYVAPTIYLTFRLYEQDPSCHWSNTESRELSWWQLCVTGGSIYVVTSTTSGTISHGKVGTASIFNFQWKTFGFIIHDQAPYMRHVDSFTHTCAIRPWNY